jgi:cytochrome P450
MPYHWPEDQLNVRPRRSRWPANFDAKVYDRPFEFDITRVREPLLAFGRGVHFCIGFHASRMVTRKVLGTVRSLREFRT